jgi:hypothetical protein
MAMNFPDAVVKPLDPALRGAQTRTTNANRRSDMDDPRHDDTVTGTGDDWTMQPGPEHHRQEDPAEGPDVPDRPLTAPMTGDESDDYPAPEPSPAAPESEPGEAD